MHNNLHTVLSVRLFTDSKSFGPGIAELLHHVDKHNSIRSAARAMELAYSKAWTIIKRSEESLGFRLVDPSTGGKNGGGAVLTDEGKRFLAAYDAYCIKLREYAEKMLAEDFSFYGEAL